jgi:hypothetical protein
MHEGLWFGTTFAREPYLVTAPRTYEAAVWESKEDCE